MWSVKSRALAGVIVLSFVLALITGQWLPFFVGLAGVVQLIHARRVFRPSRALTGARSMELERVREGDTVGIEATLSNEGRSTAFLEVRDALPRQVQVAKGASSVVAAVGPGERRGLAFDLRTPLFGVYDIGPLEARLEDPYGLFFEDREVLAPDQLLVVPTEGPVEELEPVVTTFQSFQGEYTVNQPGDGFDFYGLRGYVPGDVYRAINWKASAKTGSLMVNQFERTTSTEVTFLIDGRALAGVGPEDRTAFVQSCRAVATLLNDFFGKRDAPRLVVFGDDIQQVHPGPPDRVINEVLDLLAMWEPNGDQPFSMVVHEILPRLVGGTPVVIFSPFLDDPTMIEGVSTLLAQDFVVLAIAPPLTGLSGLPPSEAAALEASREITLNQLRSFDVHVVQPLHLDEVPGVTT